MLVALAPFKRLIAIRMINLPMSLLLLTRKSRAVERNLDIIYDAILENEGRCVRYSLELDKGSLLLAYTRNGEHK